MKSIIRRILQHPERTKKPPALKALQHKRIGIFLKMAPGWSKISYINRFDNRDYGLREYLLGWQPKVNLLECLQRTMAYYQGQHRHYWDKNL